MKHSELRNIIKEEILKALSENVEMDKMNQTFNVKAGVDPSTAKNVMKYETLPGYSELPELRKDIDFKNRKSILLPSVYDVNASSELLSKEDVKNWVEDFKKQFNENPQFKVEDTKIKVLNGLKPDFKGMKDFGGLD
jgi:hypothetical protein